MHWTHDLKKKSKLSRCLMTAGCICSECCVQWLQRCTRSAPSVDGKWQSPCGSNPGSSGRAGELNGKTTCRKIGILFIWSEYLLEKCFKIKYIVVIFWRDRLLQYFSETIRKLESLNTFLSLLFKKKTHRLSESHVPKLSVCLHATELEAVSIRLVMGGKVVVVEHPDAENGRVNARTQEEDGDKARHLVEKRKHTR